MAGILRMPEVAANAIEAVLQSWPIAENAPYATGDAIATVETEKAVVDVEAESDGVILKTLVPEGAEVQVGAPIALVGEPGEQPENLDALLAELGLAPVGPVAAAERLDLRPGPAESAVVDASTASNASAASSNGSGGRVFSSPLARRLAREAGIPVEKIPGTGPNGRIIRRDVEAAIRSTGTSSQPTAAPAGPAPATDPVTRPVKVPAATAASQTFTDIPHSRIRAAVAARLTESKQTTPHFYLRGTAHVGKLLKLRQRLNDGGPVKISVNDLVLKAAARAHLLVPAMNVIWTPDAVRSFSSVDVSVAIATGRGLVTPVLRSAEQMTVSSVATTVKDFVERAKAGRLRQSELEGGAFSVTNLGMFGTEDFAAIINPPQSAILAVGAVRQEPVVKNGRLKAGTVMRVTLSVDHRPIDGAVAAEWMRVFLALLENPVQILA
ncbi:2-oxo acid dehydrogenase subunit E2 [Actinomadura sp. HBU206391]|uniref:2-oxo acid dehydrogenase subunit E2 n=1 Tax=Actinomadura sp. HBU206391 TaxID=2731692 RepID=UPI0016505FBE|nr:2-oxo acid dehydrogenase subunit E2 [Actinomadura sp. HBU206391]MBC6458354.1 2-oxo acid dehydrogenase subunit E2 [Actinomadura sp. HBU206391]